MSDIGFISRLLAKLLPLRLEPPATCDELLEFPREIGLLSRPRAGGRPLHLPPRWRWLEHAPEETNILENMDWFDLQQFYQTLRCAAINGSNGVLNDLGWLWMNVPTPCPELTNRLLYLGAQRGSPEALYNLAEQYLYGRHLSPDLNCALHYYRRAAAALPEAAVRLGRLYLRGHYIHPSLSTDTSAALHWFHRGHDAGYCWASYYLSLYWIHHSAPHAAKDVWLQRLAELAFEGDLPVSFSASYSLALYYQTHMVAEHGGWLEFSDQVAIKLDRKDEDRLGNPDGLRLISTQP